MKALLTLFIVVIAVVLASPLAANATSAAAAPAGGMDGGAQNASILYDVWNSEACALTSTSLLSVQRSARLSRVETWYNWRAGEVSIPYTLLSFSPDGPLGGQIIARGMLVRGGCDALQSTWCVAIGPVYADVEPGQYVLHTASARICYNVLSGGPQSGFIRAYGKTF